MKALAARFLVLVLVGSLGGACDGYGDLPLPQRETAEMVVEGSDLYFGRVGTVQLRADLPEDATGPFYLVASPSILAPNANAVRWAGGPCVHPATPTPALDAQSLRLCVTVVMAKGEAASAPFDVYLIVEDRGTARRFDATATVEP